MTAMPGGLPERAVAGDALDDAATFGVSGIAVAPRTSRCIAVRTAAGSISPATTM
jgi:hypothetical protein